MASARPLKRAIVLAAMATLLLLPSISAASAQSSPVLNVNYQIQLDQNFQLYGYLTEHFSVEVSGVVPQGNTSTAFTIDFPFEYSTIIGLRPGYQPPVQTSSLGSSYNEVTVVIPSNQTSFDFTLLGTLTGLSSFFFRNIATVPPVYVLPNQTLSTPPMTVLVPDSGIQLRSVYPSDSGQLVTIGGQSFIQLRPDVLTSLGATGATLVYQSPLSDFYAFIAIVAIASVVLIAGLFVRRLKDPAKSGWQRVPVVVRSLAKKIAVRRGSKVLLGLLVVLCIAMIALSTVFGPPPEPRAYLAATPNTASNLAPLVTRAGWSYLTPAEAADGFSRTSNYGTFSAAIVADYPPPVNAVPPFISGLTYVPYVIVMTQHSPPGYLTQLESVRSNTVIVVGNDAELTGALAYVGGRHNLLGLSFSEGVYDRVAAFVGALSLLIPFLALAFLASIIVDLSGHGMYGLFEAIGYGIMVYFIAEFAFIVSTVMLGIPIAMHAAISNKETAEGFLGAFAGGTRPREIMGILGFMFGVWYNKKGSLSIDKRVLAAIIAAIAFVILDPLNFASFFYDGILVVTSNANIGATGSIYSVLRNIIGIPVGFFQSYLTVGYVASHGVALFFLALVPFFLYSRSGRGTATILLLFSALGCGLGFVRVTDMVPTETIASIAPGLLLGVVVLAAFWAFSRVEALVRNYY